MTGEITVTRLNRELRAVSRCLQTLLRSENEPALLRDVCRIVCEEAGYRMAWVGYCEDDETKSIRPVAWGGLEQGYLEQSVISWADTERGRGAVWRSTSAPASSARPTSSPRWTARSNEPARPPSG